jgi:tetratricopeptide (TPR) repeat protein
MRLRDESLYDEAAACCERLLAERPGSAEAHGNLGVALHGLGREDEALACYRAAAVTEHPTHRTAGIRARIIRVVEADVLAYMGSPVQHRAKIHSTNPLERLNGEIKRRSEVARIFPNEAAVRLIGALLLEQNDE